MMRLRSAPFVIRTICIDENGTVAVPTGPGLGVTYDADYIESHRVDRRVISHD